MVSRCRRVCAQLMSLCILAAALLAALAMLPSAANAASKGSSTLVVAIPGTPQGIDLDRQGGGDSWTIGGQVYEPGLTWKRIRYPFGAHGGVNNNGIPGFTYPALVQQQTTNRLLQSCQLSRDGRTAIYHLRRGVKSAYGDQFTASDVIWTVRRSIANKAIGAFMLSAANAANLSQWKVLNKYTVQIRSPTPMPLICLINTNEFWVYYDSTAAKKHATADDPWANSWMSFYGTGFGPYYVTNWTPGQQIVLSANKYYWQGAPTFKTVILKVVPESANRVALLEHGTVQMAEALSPEDILSLKGKPGVSVAAVRSNQGIFAIMNTQDKPFDSPKVRQAINYAIPRQQIVQNVYRGFASQWEGVIPSLYPGYINFKSYSYDLNKAKQLLADAGYPNGFSVPLTYNSEDPVQANLAVVLQSSLKQIGVTTTLQPQPGGAYTTLIEGKKVPFGLWVDFPIQPDPNYSLQLFYAKDGCCNYSGYDNPTVDQIISSCIPKIGAARIACDQKAEPLISQDAPFGWIAEPDYLIGLSSKLAGFGWYPAQYWQLADLKYRK